MADRTVKVRLEADISDFVTDVGVKAPAAVNRLERALAKANKSIDGFGSSKSLDPLASKTEALGEKLDKAGESAKKSSDKIKASATQATQATEKLTESVSKSEKATTSSGKAFTVSSKNADNYASALGRLRVAQLRLTEAQNRKGSGGSSGLAGAEESVASAERAVKKFEQAGEKSGKSFGAGLRKWLTGSGGAADVGKSGGTVFGSGFLGVLKTPILGPAVVAILTAAVLVAMPAVGALAAGAFVTAFGAGLGALGLVFAAKSQVVKDVWTKTMGQLGADMQLLSKPFESTLVNIAGYFQRTVDNFNPTLAAAFAKMAGPVDQFASQLGRAFEKLIPAIGPITEAFNAILASLGGALPGAIETMAGGFTRLAESVKQNPAALSETVTGIANLVAQISDFLADMNNLNAAFAKLTGGVSLVDATFHTLGATVGVLTAPFQAFAKGVDLVNVALGKTNKDTGTTGASMSAAAAKTADLASKLGTLGGQAQHAAAPVKSLAEQAAAAKQKIADAKAATAAWITSLFELQNLALGLAGAQISFQAAIDGVTASIKENGRSHDINTEKGRANKQALLDLAKAANDQTQSMLDNKKGVDASANAALAARAKFIQMAEKMKYTKAQATAMANAMITIPKKTVADFKGDITDLDAKIKSAKTKLADPHLTATKKAKLQAEIKQLLAAKRQAQAAIDSLSGKTVSITMNTYKNMIETTTHVDKGVRVPQANGGYWPKGVPSYANGKLPSQATIAPGKGAGMVQWAERETGGEAFIPMAPSKRDRSTKILGQVASNFGMGLVKSFADGGFLPGGKLVDIAFLLKQLGIPFNPSAGANYGNTLKAQNAANAAAAPAKAAAGRADQAETAAKATVARIQRAITLQQRYVAELRREGASKSKIAAESKETIGLQDQLYRAKLKVTAATAASSKADAAYKVKADAATAATEAHKAAVQKLIEQQQAAVDMAAQISDALTSGANIGDLFQDSLTGKGLLADLQAQGAKTGVFGGQISKLRARGLSEDLIQQIIGKGAEQGGEVAQAILDGGQGLVNALNKAQKALDDQANLIGAGSANKKYGQTIAGARADGGDVMAGKTYRINERGEELFQPKVSGRIIPHQYIGAFGAGGTSRSETHYHLNQQFTGVSMAEADLIGRRSLAVLRLAGRR